VTRFLAQTIEHNNPEIKIEKIKLNITLFTYAASLNIDPNLQKALKNLFESSPGVKMRR
jgi:hypothetical protein